MAKSPRSLVGNVVAITGGARGIGRATAAALIAQGARVAIGDIDETLVRQTAEELGSGTVGLGLDVTDRGSFSAFLDEVEQALGPLDVVINNAGIMPVGSFIEETDATSDRMIDINLRGVVLGSRLALARFVPRRRGDLVNIASIAGKGGSPHLATYCATKHAVVGLTEALRLEFADAGIGFMLVMPIGVNTDLYSGLQPLRGMKTAEPEDVANAIVEALQTGRYEVYIPKRMNAIVRSGALMPRRALDAVNKLIGGGDVMTHPDHGARAAYEQRLAAASAPRANPATAPSESGSDESPSSESPSSESIGVGAGAD